MLPRPSAKVAAGTGLVGFVPAIQARKVSYRRT